MTDTNGLIAYALDRFGNVSHTRVLEGLVHGIDPNRLRQAIAEYGPEAVAEHYLRTVIGAGTVYGDCDVALAETDRLLDTDPHASPRMHAVTVADLADVFTRQGLTEPPVSDYP